MRWVCIFLLTPFFAYASMEEVKFYTEDAGLSSYMDDQNQLHGFSVDIVQEMIKRSGGRNSIELVPWVRGYTLALDVKGSAVFATCRTRERENLFKWVGPLNNTRVVFYQRAESRLKISKLEDAKKAKKIGCYVGDFRTKILEKAGFRNLECITGDLPNSRNLKKLASGRIELWVSSETDLAITANRIKVNPGHFKRAFVIEESPVNIAFHKQTPEVELKKWQGYLDQLKKDGTYRAIMKKYKVDPSIWAIE